jgi:hypothetical protein
MFVNTHAPADREKAETKIFQWEREGGGEKATKDGSLMHLRVSGNKMWQKKRVHN